MARYYVDSSVLIAAASGRGAGAEESVVFLDNLEHELVSSAFVVLESYPAAAHNKRRDETAYYDWFFSAADLWIEASEEVAQLAVAEAKRVHGLTAMDALHLAAASLAKADALVTLEGETRPLFRSRLLPVMRLV